MNKQEYIDAISEKTGISKKDCGELLDACYSVLVETLKAGDELVISGIGKFEVREREERDGRDPRTGATIKIAASKAPSFKAGKTFKADIQ